MNTIVRDRTILWLEENRKNGAFDGFMEENMDFDCLSDEDILWYFDNWYMTEDYFEMLKSDPLDEIDQLLVKAKRQCLNKCSN
jgi:hypothetical protein